jgi:dienelactone hydrolase
VSFDSDGDRIAGHLYRPLGAAEDERTAGIVVTGPISSGKEQAVPLYAARLAAAGYKVLTFAARNFGEPGDPAVPLRPGARHRGLLQRRRIPGPTSLEPFFVYNGLSQARLPRSTGQGRECPHCGWCAGRDPARPR